jgi:valyl-tRNA synthetase
MTAPWPQFDDVPLSQDLVALQQFECFMDIVKAVRNARAEHNVTIDNNNQLNLTIHQ